MFKIFKNSSMNHKMTPEMKMELRRKLNKNTEVAKHFRSLAKDPDGFKKGISNELGLKKDKKEILAHAVTIICMHIMAEQKGFSSLDDIKLENREPDKTVLDLIRAMKILGVIIDLDGYALHNKMLNTLVEIFQIPLDMVKRMYDGIHQTGTTD